MFGVALCLWVLALLGSHGVRAIVIATHCAEGILVGADSLETTQSVLVDQLYAQKIYQGARRHTCAFLRLMREDFNCAKASE